MEYASEHSDTPSVPSPVTTHGNHYLWYIATSYTTSVVPITTSPLHPAMLSLIPHKQSLLQHAVRSAHLWPSCTAPRACDLRRPFFPLRSLWRKYRNTELSIHSVYSSPQWLRTSCSLASLRLLLSTRSKTNGDSTERDCCLQGTGEALRDGQDMAHA